MSGPLYGLVLAGGKSSRMQRDKAALVYHGQPQLKRAFELVAKYTDEAFVSVRTDQTSDPLRKGYPMLVDSVPGEGPMVGIRSALAKFPRAAWLVLACDLPFASDAVLVSLKAQRDPRALATAYASSRDGLPEPLCAIWEPAAAAALAEFVASGKDCPRKFLLRHTPVRLLSPLDPQALDNVNTPEEYSGALNSLSTHPMQLKVQYFALMREQAGRSEETLESAATTPADLYGELVARYGFTLPREQLKVAVNSEFADWSRRLASGDAVVFIPPVAGG